MTALAPIIASGATTALTSRTAIGESPVSLADIYQDEVNIAIWQRELTHALSDAANVLLNARPNLKIAVSLSPQSVRDTLSETLGTGDAAQALATDIAELAEMFSCLFDINHVGLRLTSLGHAMCPRFHVDNVPCRLVTTYIGSATEWLPHDRVERSRLGPLSEGVADELTGLYSSRADIQQLQAGHVALLKGEGWEGNENAGLVHRSPQLTADGRRLLLTLDFSRS